MSVVKTQGGYTKPKQRVAKSAKTKEWGRDSAQYYRDACVPAIDREEALKLVQIHQLTNP